MTEKWNDQVVLVTGAGGFIGSRLVEKLILQGAHVRTFVRYTSRAEIGLLKQLPSEIIEKIEIIRGDLRDYNAVDQAAKGVDTVFHLGALISIPYSYVHPVETVQTNIDGTLNVLEACRIYGSKLFDTS